MTPSGPPSPLEAALAYAGRGWPVFPCHSPQAGGCSCGDRGCSSVGKHPRVARGVHAASTEPAQVEQWWARWPAANVAVATGARSGLVVLDVDPADGGAVSLQGLLRLHGELPPGLRARTGGGGAHLYFAHPGVPVANSAGTVGHGLDVRGDGGYVLAPPSRHASGRPYRWGGGESRLPPLPGWVMAGQHAREAPGPGPSLPDRPRREPSAWARAALAAEEARVGASVTGFRNHTLNSAAFSLGQLVAMGLLERDEVEQALAGAAERVGLGARETTATLRSGIVAGLRNPRRPGTAAEHVSPPASRPGSPELTIALPEEIPLPER